MGVLSDRHASSAPSGRNKIYARHFHGLRCASPVATLRCPFRAHRCLRTLTFSSYSSVLVALISCAGTTGCLQPAIKPGEELKRKGDEIVVCGRLFHTGTRVVLWTDPDGFDGYRVHRRFSNTDEITPSSPISGTDTPNRYSPMRGNLPPDVAARVAERGWSLEDLQKVVDLFVIHYDVCGTSRRCFEVLHDVRGLSVHFMLDVDGTIYQTLDLKERARHAGSANDRSIGIEIANMGAYDDPETLAKWYRRDADGRVRLIPPGDWQSNRKLDGTIIASDALRPAGNCIIAGEINGKLLYQFDLTDAQYDALIQLTATVARVLPEIGLSPPLAVDSDEAKTASAPSADIVGDGPLAGTQIHRRKTNPNFTMMAARRPDGTRTWGCFSAHPESTTLDADVLKEHRGLIGHYHLTKDKSDPGPAFDWSRVSHGASQLVPPRRLTPD